MVGIRNPGFMTSCMEVLGAGIYPHDSVLSSYQEEPSRAHGGPPTHQRLRLVEDDHQCLPTELNQVKKRPSSLSIESEKRRVEKLRTADPTLPSPNSACMCHLSRHCAVMVGICPQEAPSHTCSAHGQAKTPAWRGVTLGAALPNFLLTGGYQSPLRPLLMLEETE